MAAPIILEIQVSPQQRALLQEVAGAGIVGSTVDEVAEWAVGEWIRDAWRDGLCGPRKAKR